MRKIVKISSVLGAAVFIKMLAGAARAKFLAWQLGPAGMGLIGQALMYSVFAMQFCSLNIATGVTKAVSEGAACKDMDRVHRVVNISALLQLLASLVFIIAILPFSSLLARFIFSDSKYWPYFAGITLSTPFALYLTGMADPILLGFKKAADYTRLIVIYTLTGLFLVVILVWFYKVYGMLLGIIASSAAAFFISNYFMYRKLGLRPAVKIALLRDEASGAVYKHLFEYGLLTFVMGNVGMFVMLYLRSLFMKDAGMEANGYYQTAYAISSYYLPFVTNSVWGYFYPEMCSVKEVDQINRELNKFIRFVLLASTAIAIVCIVFRKYIVLLLFSERFLKASVLLAIQAMGDILFLLFYVFTTALMARRRIRGIVGISIIAYNAVLITAYFFLSHVSASDFRNLNLAVFAANFIVAVVYMIYSARAGIGLGLTRGNYALLMKCGVAVAVISAIPERGVLSMAAALAAAMIWLAMSVTRSEAAGFLKLAYSHAYIFGSAGKK